MTRKSPVAVVTLWLLSLGLTALLIVDGVLHLRLNYLLNNGTLWGPIKRGASPPGPPPGAPNGAARPAFHPPANPFPLPLNEMFTLNFLAAIVLAAAFLLALRWLPRWAVPIDLAFIAFAAISIYGWWQVGKPNPQNLGHISKLLEVVMIALALVHGALLLKLRVRRARRAAEPSVPAASLRA